MLTAYPPKDADWVTTSYMDKVLVKPMNTQDLLRQIEAMLVAHEDKKRKESDTKLRALTAASAVAKKPRKLADAR
jgi:hypothetical protein